MTHLVRKNLPDFILLPGIQFEMDSRDTNLSKTRI